MRKECQLLPPKPPKKHIPQKPQCSNSYQPPLNQSIKPINRRFFYIAEEDIDLTSTNFIPASKFINDFGNIVTSFPLKRRNGYSNLYINGVMQQGNSYFYTNNGLTIKAIGDIIYASTPIIIETVEFFMREKKGSLRALFLGDIKFLQSY
jgi:hypothetical protein